MQHIRCAPGATLGEEIAAEFLRNAFQNSDAVLLSNYNHPKARDTATDEIDLVLINERGVWLLETKHWYGLITGDPHSWYHAGYSERSPIESIESKARRVAGAVRAAVGNGISTVGLVVLTTSKNDSDFQVADPLTRKVFWLDQDLLDAVTGSDFLIHSGSRRLNANEIQRIAQHLHRQSVNPQNPIVGGYRMLRTIEQGAINPSVQYRIYEAQQVESQRRARAKRYELSGLDKIPDIARAAERFKQDMRALTLIEEEGHPNVVRAFHFQPDPDTSTVYWLILEWIDGPTLRNMIERQPLPFKAQLSVILAAAQALSFCHTKGIIHRNITPNSIYITSQAKIKLGDFDFARVPSVRTISVRGEGLAQNIYTAPEIYDDASAANERSDIYSLGAVWYDTIFKLKPDETILLSRVDQAGISDQARQVLRRLIAPQPFNRPASAAEVVQLLQNLRS